MLISRVAKAAFGVRVPGYPPNKIMHFYLNQDYFCSVTIRKSGNTYRDKENPTEEDLFKILQGKGDWSSVQNEDHPEFKKLRELLGMQGYIKIQRSWSNGDIVLKEFRLNGYNFKKGDRFPCAAALGTMKIWTKQQ